MWFYEADSMNATSSEAVWAVLRDGVTWSAWNSGVEAVEGRIELGGTMRIRSQAAPRRTFSVNVTTFDPLTRLQFSGGMPSGLFRPMVWRSIPGLRPSLDRFAQGLKQRVETAR
jgi:hypothetical protein